MVGKTGELLVEMTKKAAGLYFASRDYEALLAYLSPEINWIGTGRNEICHNIQEAKHFFEAETKTYDGAFEVSEE